MREETADLTPQLVTIRQAAHLLSLSPRTLQEWTAAERIASVRLGRAVRIPRAEIDRLVREGLKPLSATTRGR